MATQMKTAIERAIRNTIAFGDTDVFPFPFERYLLEDKFAECVQILHDRHKTLTIP